MSFFHEKLSQSHLNGNKIYLPLYLKKIQNKKVIKGEKSEKSFFVFTTLCRSTAQRCIQMMWNISWIFLNKFLRANKPYVCTYGYFYSWWCLNLCSPRTCTLLKFMINNIYLYALLTGTAWFMCIFIFLTAFRPNYVRYAWFFQILFWNIYFSDTRVAVKCNLLIWNRWRNPICIFPI